MMKNQDKKQKRLDDAKKKIPGRGYRTPVPTPLTLPYELERDYYSKNLACTWNEEYGGLYIGESKYAKKVLDNGKIVGKKRGNAAFVKPHKQGFLFIQQNLSGNKSYKKTIIPGELGLAKTLDILAEKIIPIKRAYDDLEILKLHKNKKDPDKEINNFFLIARLNFEKNNTNLYKEVSRKARKLEIAAALLANGIWQKRGFVDKEKIAPKGFWHKITPEEACKGDKRSMQKWWLDALYREAIDMPIALLYLEEKKKERNIAMRENARLVNNNDKYVNIDGNEYLIKRDGVDDAILKAKMDKDNDKNYQMRGLTQRASLLVPIKKAIEEGKLPNYPWEIRNWDKLKFSLYKKSLLFGIHNAKNWNQYVGQKTPGLERALLYTGKYMNNGFLEKISEENIKHIEKYIELQLQDKKFEAAQYIKNQFEKKRPLDTFNTSFEFNYLNSNDNVEEFKEELRETVKTGKSQKKPIFEKYSIITPRFSPPDGWNWDNDKRTDIAKENILFKTNKNHSKPAMICWKKTNGIMKEALLQYTLVDVKTGASLSKEGEFPIDIYKEQEVEKKLEFISYRNCDLRDLRTLKIFERALNALHITIDLKENYQDGLEVHPTLRRQIEKNMEKLIQVTQTSESSRR